jgi:hypothetical protein
MLNEQKNNKVKKILGQHTINPKARTNEKILDYSA